MFESNDDDVDELLSGVFEDEDMGFDCTFLPAERNTLTSLKHPQDCGNSQLNLYSKNVLNKAESNKSFASPSSLIHSMPSTSKQSHFPFVTTELPPGCSFDYNKENKRKQEILPGTSRPKRERKFPGPAGLLPDRKSLQTFPVKLDFLLEDEKSSPNPTSEDLCSQGRLSGSILEEEPWQNFLTDLGEDRNILEVVNIASIKRKATAKCFVGRKVPFLAAVLYHIDMTSPDPSVVLRDSTGEIHGTLHRAVWEQFAGELTVGSVIVIRNAGVISTGISSRKHFLNITANNLATIYAAKMNQSRKTELHPFTSQDILKTIENWRALVSPSHGLGSPALVGSPTLFNTSVCPSSTSSPIQNHLNHSPHFASNTNMETSKNHFNNKLSGYNPKLGPSSFSHGLNAPGTPVNCSNRGVMPRVTGKNLMPSFTKGTSFNNTMSKSVPYNNNSLNNAHPLKGCNSRSIIQTSFQTNNNNRALYPEKFSSDDFKFDPVVLPTKKFNDVFPQTNSERQPNIQHVSRNNQNKFLSKTISNPGLNSPIILSQSSQLTAEEQSVIESVFDGVDADSLFEDDF